MVRLLHVTIYEGAGLAEHKSPYVVAELLDLTGRPIKNERAKTKPAVYGHTVVWTNTEKSGGGRPDLLACSPVGTPTEERGSLLDDDSPAGVKLTLGRKHDLRSVGVLPTLRLSVWGREVITKDTPLGMTLVDLATLPQDGSISMSWRELEPAISMGLDVPCGSLNVGICLEAAESSRMFSRAIEAGVDMDSYVEGMEEGCGYEDEEYSDQEPNLLVVRVRGAKGLVGMDSSVMGGEDTSDPYVVLTCDGVEHKTKVIEKTRDPEWDETFEFAVKEHSRRLQVIVNDYDLVMDDFLGACSVKLEDLVHRRRVTRWFRLLDAEERLDEENPLGEIELSIQWIHDPRAKDLATKNLTISEMVQRTLGLYDGTSSDTDDGDAHDSPDGNSTKPRKASRLKLPKSAKEKKAEKEKEEALAAERALQEEELSNIEIKSGDYTIYVHIIEVRDLKAEDVQGTSDPVVYVEAFDQKLATEVKQACLSAVFDETFVISLRNLDKDVFEEGVIRVSVMDADGPAELKSDLIGSYSFDAANVYFHKHHELHRQWVALVDDENPNDSGTQGYLQLSIAIVGPGDKLKVHDEAEDRRKEREAEAKSGGIDGLVMIPPSVHTRTQWLVTTAWKAEYLPIMDTGPLVRQGGDFFTTVSVSGGAPARSTTKGTYGNRSAMNPVWRQQLWVPTTIPSMSGTIKTCVWDHDYVGDEMVGCVNIKMKEIESMKDRRHSPRWYSIYGAPLKTPASTDLAEMTRRLADDGQRDWRMIYSTLPQKSSTYRGRILLSREIREELPPGKRESTPWRRKVRSLARKREPGTSRYAMRCYVASGSSLPQSASVTRLGKNFKMAIRISMGADVLETRMVENSSGVCEWGELLESKDPIVLPSDMTQMPDVFVHLLRGTTDTLPVCFFRLPAKELLEKGFADACPRWMLLKEDKVLDCLPKGQYPGSVLVKLAVGNLREFAATAKHWEEEALRLRKRTSYLLRVHVYQGRDLPASDSNGLMDPYLTLQCLGEQFNTETFMHMGKAVHRRRATVDPMWYFTWEADLNLPPEDLHAYFPQVSIKLTDYDPFDVDDHAGSLFLDLADCPIDPDHMSIPPPPTPSWKSFFLESPGDSSGELLLSCQLIKTPRVAVAVGRTPDLSPELRSAYMEVLALGVRGLQPYQMLPMQLPYMEIGLDLPNGSKISLSTDPSKTPTGTDANFLQRLKIPVELPVEEIFSPRLKLCVRDIRLGGFLTPVVAVGAVDLITKLPWSRSYQPPASSTVCTIDIMGATGAPVFEHMFDTVGVPGTEGETKTTIGDPAPPSPAEQQNPLQPAGNRSNGDGAVRASKSSGGGGKETRAPNKSSTAVARSTRLSEEGLNILSGSTSSAGSDAQISNPLFSANSKASSRAAGGGLGIRAGGRRAGSGEVLFAMDGEVGGETAAPEIEMVDVMGQEDEGAGVFGALLHAPDVREKVREVARVARGATGPEDEDDGPPKYMTGRRTVESELERELGTTPFETYTLYRGQKFGGDEGEGEYHPVGKFKCVIRVTLGDPDEEPMFAPDRARNEEILNELLKPKGYKLRLYVLQAINLTPMDLGIGGRPGKSDPYVNIRLGKEAVDDRKNYIDDVTDADLYKCFEVNCTLPGASQLQIEVKDYDDIGQDDLIGRTVIDLEDRWFDQRWQAIGLEHRSEDTSSQDTMRWQTKPVENRSLYVPTSNAPQGVLRCWVDIMPPGEAKAFGMDDISLPPPSKFEVRLVIWKCKDVVSADFLSGLNDLYVKAWVESCESQETDTHWRAKGGKGSFNWRMKFQVELGPRCRATKFPYLTLQMWDRDILKWNDCIAECMLDLGTYFRRAYKKKNQVLKMFESQLTEKGQQTMIETQQALVDEQAEALQLELKTGIPNPLLGDPLATDLASPTSSHSAEIGERGGRPGDRPAADDADDRQNTGCCCWKGKVPMTPLELREENDRRRTMGMPLLDVEEGLTKKEAKKRRKEEGDEEIREMLQKVKVMAGLSNDDPPDTKWIKMEQTDRKTGRKEPMGQCLIGIKIYPIEKAELQPAGIGRSEPNADPFVPPPTGRLSFTWNPISMISQLLGPRLCCILCCCLMIALVVTLLIVFQPLWNLLIALATS